MRGINVFSLALVVCSFLLCAGCASSPQSAPQIPLAPVYQAGSPVVVNVIAGSCGGEQTGTAKSPKPPSISVSRVGHDARGDVGAEGEQTAAPTQTTDVDATVPVDAGGGAVKNAVKALTGASGEPGPSVSPAAAPGTSPDPNP